MKQNYYYALERTLMHQPQVTSHSMTISLHQLQLQSCNLTEVNPPIEFFRHYVNSEFIENREKEAIAILYLQRFFRFVHQSNFQYPRSF